MTYRITPSPRQIRQITQITHAWAFVADLPHLSYLSYLSWWVVAAGRAGQQGLPPTQATLRDLSARVRYEPEKRLFHGLPKGAM